MAIQVTDTTDFKSQMVTRDKESHYIIIKISIQQKNISIINIHAPNITAAKYMKQTLTELKGERQHTIIHGYFNIPI